MTGWFAVPRGWRGDSPFRGEPFSRGDAWLWILEHAAWRVEPAAAWHGSVTLEKGELLCAQRGLALAWAWSLGRVQRFLSDLERANLLGRRRSGRYVVLTVAAAKSFRESRTESNSESQKHAATPCQTTLFPDLADRRESKTESTSESDNIKKKNRRSLRRESAPPQVDLLPGAEVVAIGVTDPVTQAYEMWNAFAACHDLPLVETGPGPRAVAARRPGTAALLREVGGCPGLALVLDRMGVTPFLLGAGQRRWRASFDWLIRPTSVAQLLAGQYDQGADRVDHAFDDMDRRFAVDQEGYG